MAAQPYMTPYGIPQNQAFSSFTGYPDFAGYLDAYRTTTGTVAGAAVNYSDFFVPMGKYDVPNAAVWDIPRFGPVFCLKRSLIDPTRQPAAVSVASNRTEIIKIYGALNHYVLDLDGKAFITVLNSHKQKSFNNTYTTELFNALLMPMGTAKAEWKFIPTEKTRIATQPIEIDSSGIVLAPVRSRNFPLFVGMHCRWAIPTPDQWRVDDWYHHQETRGAITMYVQPVDPRIDSVRFRSVFSGYYGNETHLVDFFLRKLINSGHKSLIPMHGLPVTFDHLVAAISIGTLHDVIASRTFELNNDFKYENTRTPLKEALQAHFNANAGRSLEQLIISFFALYVRPATRFQTYNLVMSLLMEEDMSYYPGGVGSAPVRITENDVRPLIANRRQILDAVATQNHDYDGEPDRNVFTPELHTFRQPEPARSPLNNDEFIAELHTKGDAAYRWTDALYYLNNSSYTPLFSEAAPNSPGDDVEMFGSYTLREKNNTNVGGNTVDQVDNETLVRDSNNAAMEFATAACQLMGMTIPSTEVGAIPNRARIEKHFVSHSEDPQFLQTRRDAEIRIRKFNESIVKTILSETLHVDEREQYRVGFDHVNHVNEAMAINRETMLHEFDTTKEEGIVAQDIASVFGEFSKALMEVTGNELTKMKTSIMASGQKGQRATGQINQ